jgi:sodium-dependent dicarboxylate transporter 2/3/5
MDTSRRYHNLALIAGPLTATIAAIACVQSGLAAPVAITVAITLWCALWWMLDAMPHAITALLPLALFPLTGVLSASEVAEAYGNELILLLAGGFMLAAALERNNAHRRMALSMVRWFGGRDGRHLVFGFAAAAGLISMWISNTATTLMLLPVALAVLDGYPDRRLAAPLVLAIAYGANIGGLGTPVGSPPNLVFMRVYAQNTGSELGFLDWMAFGLPTVALLLPMAALWLGRGLAGTPSARVPVLGPWQPGERRVLLVFAVVALAWITRSEPFGGWRMALGLDSANDASVALLGVIAMALLPDGAGSRLLTWEAAERIPWGALILFGGGIAIATAFQTSGLSELLALHMQVLDDVPLLARIALLTAVTVRHSPSIRRPMAAVNCQRWWWAEPNDAGAGYRGVYRG